MQTATSEVKSQSVKVGVATYSVFETVEEAVEGLGGVESVLKRLNAQVRTDAMNTIRSAATGKMTKAQLTTLAFAKMATDEGLNKRARDIGGDPTKLNLLLAEICDGIQKEHTESLQAKTASLAEPSEVVEVDPEEDDEE